MTPCGLRVITCRPRPTQVRRNGSFESMSEADALLAASRPNALLVPSVAVRIQLSRARYKSSSGLRVLTTDCAGGVVSFRHCPLVELALAGIGMLGISFGATGITIPPRSMNVGSARGATITAAP